ncbi:MAG TPA: 50S ribosomal protein L13 [Patescibacteria group bacterium]|nr:50S ribosomal protein L13 [Patescibacteria group bacterium]
MKNITAQRKSTTVAARWHLFDARGAALGRLATAIVRILRGKDNVSFAPHKDSANHVVVINADKVVVTGNKERAKLYHRFSGYPGGIRSLTTEEVRTRDARKLIEYAVFGMLPKNKLRARMLRRLHLYCGERQPHTIDKTLAIGKKS